MLSYFFLKTSHTGNQGKKFLYINFQKLLLVGGGAGVGVGARAGK
jgi:hypothetical protein